MSLFILTAPLVPVAASKQSGNYEGSSVPEVSIPLMQFSQGAAFAHVSRHTLTKLIFFDLGDTVLGST